VLYMRLGSLDVNHCTDQLGMTLNDLQTFHTKQQEFMRELCEVPLLPCPLLSLLAAGGLKGCGVCAGWWRLRHHGFVRQEASRQEGRIVQKFTYVIDLADASLGRHLSTLAREFFSNLVNTDSRNYPEALGHIYIINTSRIFPVIWSFVKNMVCAPPLPTVSLRADILSHDRSHVSAHTVALGCIFMLACTHSVPQYHPRWTPRPASGWRCLRLASPPTKAGGAGDCGLCWGLIW
jgi:hypothetical protein